MEFKDILIATIKKYGSPIKENNEITGWVVRFNDGEIDSELKLDCHRDLTLSQNIYTVLKSQKYNTPEFEEAVLKVLAAKTNKS